MDAQKVYNEIVEESGEILLESFKELLLKSLENLEEIYAESDGEETKQTMTIKSCVLKMSGKKYCFAIESGTVIRKCTYSIEEPGSFTKEFNQPDLPGINQ